VTIPLPAIAPARLVASRWLATIIPDLQTGKGLLTPIESWASDVYATLSYISGEPDIYVPVHDNHVQIDVWGRPAPEGQYRGVPLNRCNAIVNYIQEMTMPGNFNPLVIDMSGNYRDVHLSDAYVTDMGEAVSERPAGATVALSRARLTVCFVYKVLDS
jgi:hypothetical protein